MFGHESGAFTGASRQKTGLVEAAEGGTLLLDEIGELPTHVQTRLLSFLEQRSYRRVGGVRSIAADVRIFAATNVNLEAAVSSGRFRSDLYYRLCVFPLRLPPLRERAAEIPALAQGMLRDLGALSTQLTLAADIVARLIAHSWPGNIRELRNVLERALILAQGRPLRVADLPEQFQGIPEHAGQGAYSPAQGIPAPAPLWSPPDQPPQTELDQVETAHILHVLEQAGGNRSAAARALGISRSTLKRKLLELRGRGWTGI